MTQTIPRDSIRVRQATRRGWVECPRGGVFDYAYPDSRERRGRVQEGGRIAPTVCSALMSLCVYEGPAEEDGNGACRGISRIGGLCRGGAPGEGVPKMLQCTEGNVRPRTYDNSTTITTSSWQHQNFIMTKYRIRKLTPKECFRLMDVDDSDIQKIQDAGISNTQQYKMAGNSIVVACLEHILRQLYFPSAEVAAEPVQLTFF